MKRIISCLLLVLCAALSFSCTAADGRNGTPERSSPAAQTIRTLFETVCPADEALEQSRKTGAVVFEKQGCTSGNDVWDAFYQTAMGGSPAAVLCAHYYVLDKENVSPELYEEEKDQYPKTFFSLIEFDGKEYAVQTRESDAEAPGDRETFPYLLHRTGDAPSAEALFSSYDIYVLAEDPEVTMEDIWAGLASSQSGAVIRHCIVYQNYFGWKADREP